MKREQVREYIEILIQNEQIMKPYYDLLGDDLEIYEAVWATEQTLRRAYNIPEWIDDNIIRSYTYWVVNCPTSPHMIVRDNSGNPIWAIDALIDYIFEEWANSMEEYLEEQE